MHTLDDKHILFRYLVRLKLLEEGDTLFAFFDEFLFAQLMRARQDVNV